MRKPLNFEEYISVFPLETQEIMQQLRAAIQTSAPLAVEVISYGMPAFKLNGKVLVYYAAYQNHIGLYPAPRAIEEFKSELSAFKGGKGTIQFPLDKPMPFELITSIVKFRVEENLHISKTKKK
jgi:uncharacterized protein YdhG (YjbR/CyaY superfamily)